MAEGEDYLATVWRYTREGRLMLEMELVEKIMNCTRYSWKDWASTLLGQVHLARRKNRIFWLMKVAREANILRFASREWVCREIHELPQAIHAPRTLPACYQDIRPNVERQTEVVEPEEFVVIDEVAGDMETIDEVLEDRQWGVQSYCLTSTQEGPSEAEQITVAWPGIPSYGFHAAGTRPDQVEPTGSAGSKRTHQAMDARAPKYRKRDEISEASKIATTGVEAVPGRSNSPEVPEHQRCPLSWCGGNYKKFKKAHIYHHHYPTKLGAGGSPRDVSRQDIVEALEVLAGMVSGRSDASPHDLMEWVNQEELTAAHSERQVGVEAEDMAMKACEELGISRPSQLSLYPVNTPGLCLHWAVLLEILRRLTSEQYNVFISLFSHSDWQAEKKRLAPMPSSTPTPSSTQTPTPSAPTPSADLTIVKRDRQHTVEVAQIVPENVDWHPASTEKVDRTVTRVTVRRKINRDSDQALASCHTGVVDRRQGGATCRTGVSPERDLRNTGRTGPLTPDSAHSRLLSRDLMEAVDSHFYLDQLCSAARMTLDYVRVVRELQPRREVDRVELRGAVANFCDPATYPTKEQIRELRSRNVAVTVGLHPKRAMAATPEVLHQLRTLVANPDVIGVGDVGLDHSAPRSEWAVQRDVLDQVLRMVGPHHVLVIHCRSERQGSEDELTSIFHHCRGALPFSQPIHLHCFTGTRHDIRRWQSFFRYVYYGFASMPDRSEEQEWAIRAVPEGQLLLETNAPYFAPDGYRTSAPTFVGFTARDVAQVRGERVKDILRMANKNAARLYRVLWMEW